MAASNELSGGMQNLQFCAQTNPGRRTKKGRR